MNVSLASSLRSVRPAASDDDLLALRSYAFESLSANATVLDGRGEIVDTNEAWRLFARLNDGSPGATGRGVSYLTVCDRAAESGDRVAAEVATGLREILSGDRERYTLDYPCPSPTEDRWFRLEASSAPVVGGGGVVLFHVDVTADKRREGHLMAEAERDALTGLPNRRGAVRAIEEHLVDARRGDPICVAFLDLDAFKAVNDRYGHQVGDQLLVKVGVRASGAVRHDDVVCRIGGDEFVLICPSIRPGEVASILARLRWSLSQPYQIGSIELDVGVSIGHVLSGADATVDRLLAGSDAMMYRDKEERRLAPRDVRHDGGSAAATSQMSPKRGPRRWNGIERRMRRRRSTDRMLEGTSVDLGERTATEARLIHEMSHDMLTGLPTRLAFCRLLDDRLVGARAPSTSLPTLMLIDIGPLDTVNDLHGHTAGDDLVLRCSKQLERLVHPGDEVARFSDHIFAVHCLHGDGTPMAAAHARNLCAGLAAPLARQGMGQRLRVSAGVIVVDPEDPRSADELLRCANLALAQARSSGPVAIFDQALADDVAERGRIDRLVGELVDAGSVRLGYQPIIRLDDRQTVGAEALLRVPDAAGATVPACEIVAAAERTGLMGELGHLVLHQACADAAGWRSAFPDRPLHVSVNLSAHQLGDPTLPARIAAVLTATGLDASALCLEVTESALMADPTLSVQVLRDIRDQGIRLAVDDFGTGYSSLSYLKALPLDLLKIDRSFVTGLPRCVADVAIVQAVTAMAEVLDLTVVAEGIENVAQLQHLVGAGVRYAQGFLWSPAISGADIERRLATEAGGQ